MKIRIDQGKQVLVYDVAADLPYPKALELLERPASYGTGSGQVQYDGETVSYVLLGAYEAKKRPFSLYLPAPLMKRVKELAASDSLTVSAFVQNAISAYIAKRE